MRVISDPVFAIRCTTRLMDRMRVKPDPIPPPPTTVLGDWYSNVIRIGRTQLILAVSERTLLPVILPAVDAKSLPRRMPEYLFDVLKRLDIPLSTIDRELREMQQSVIAKTASRSVLGILNEFTVALHYRDEVDSLANVALWLAETPCHAGDSSKATFPDRATVAALKESLH